MKKSSLFHGVSSGALLAALATSVLADPLTVAPGATVSTAVETATAANNSPGNVTISGRSPDGTQPEGTIKIATTGATVTLNYDNTFIDSSGLIQNTATTGAIGVNLKGGFTGGFTAEGVVSSVINITGSGANNYGLLLNGNGTFTGNITFLPGSQILTYGTSPTAIAINAPLAGNLNLGAAVTTIGQGATAVLVTQAINGQFGVSSSLTIAGTSSYTSDKVDPTSGSGIAIGANISQGFLITGPIGSGDGTGSGSVTNSSELPAVVIAPSIGGNLSDVTIGALVNDIGKINFSVVNRGSISNLENDTGVSTIGMRIGDIVSGAKSVTLDNGFYNRGAISASSRSDNTRSTSVTATATNATGLEIGNTKINEFMAPPQTVGSAWTSTSGNSGGNLSTATTVVLGDHASDTKNAYNGLFIRNDATGEEHLITGYTVDTVVGNVTDPVTGNVSVNASYQLKTVTIDGSWTLGTPANGGNVTIEGNSTNTIILGGNASTIAGSYNHLTVTTNGQQRLITGYTVIFDPTVTAADIQNGVDPTTLKVATVGAALPGSPSTWGSTPVSGDNVTISGRALVNDGSIGASMGGTAGGTVTALLIHQGANVPTLTNNGSIQASAGSTDLTISNLKAIGIQDLSGTLGVIYTTQSIAAAATKLDNNSQVAIALDLAYRTGNETIYVLNQGSLSGEVRLGAGTNTLIIEGGGTTTVANITTPFYATVTSSISSATNGTLDISISEQKTGGVLNTSNTTARNVNVGEGGNIQFALAKSSAAAPLITAQNVTFTTSPAATAPAKFTLAPTSFLPSSGSYTLINAGSGAVHFDNFAAAAGLANDSSPFPFLVNGSFSGTAGGGPVVLDAATTTADVQSLQVNIQRKSAAELGLQGSSAAIYEPFSDAALNDDQYGAALLKLTNAAQVQAAVNATIPDIAGGVRALTVAMTDQATGVIGSRQRQLLTAPKDTRTDFRFWGQEFYNIVADHGTTAQPGFGGAGQGVSIGGEWGSLETGRYGVGYTFFSSQETERHPRDTKTNGDWNMVSAYAAWKFGDFFVAPQLNAGVGAFASRREIVVSNLVQRTARANWSSYLGAGGATAGYIIDVGSFQLIPTIALDGMYLNASSYEEGGGGGMGLSLKSQSMKSFRTFAGLIGQGNYAYNEGAFLPQVVAGWSHEFINDPATIDGTFESTPGSPFHLVGPTVDTNKIVGGMSFGYVLRNWSAGFNYDAAASSGSLAQSATISLTSRF